MCFSATASFGSSAVIAAVGIISFRQSATTPQKVLSCIPLVFALQQFSEGIVWLTLTHAGIAPWDRVATYAFLVFAQVVWPVLVPLSVWLLETESRRRKAMGGLLAAGAIVATFLCITLVLLPVRSTISCSHIVYQVDYPGPFKHLGIFYFLVTVVPPLISTIKRLRLMGIAILVAYVVTRIFYEQYLISVWCYFAAIISVIILSVIVELKNSGTTEASLPGPSHKPVTDL